jgi:hypothetical protein
VAAATGSDSAFGALLADAEAQADAVRSLEIAPGPGADAVLAAANSPDASSSASVVTQFGLGSGRIGPDDYDSDYRFLETEAGTLPAQTLTAHGTQGEGASSLSYVTASGPQSVVTESWVEYVRAEGSVFWLAEDDGEHALTDGSLRGWAFVNSRASLVDAARVGVWLAVYPIG